MQVKEMTKDQKDRRSKSTIRKWEGDDRYSWALFVNGRPVYNGMDRNEAKWRRDRYIESGTL